MRVKSSEVARSATMPKKLETAKPGAAIKRVESTPAGKREYWWKPVTKHCTASRTALLCTFDTGWRKYGCFCLGCC